MQSWVSAGYLIRIPLLCRKDWSQVRAGKSYYANSKPGNVFSRYSIREGILIYNQHDLKMIWFRLLALMLVVFTTVPMITYSLSRMLAISNLSPDDLTYSLFKVTSMTFVYYTLFVLSVRTDLFVNYYFIEIGFY